MIDVNKLLIKLLADLEDLGQAHEAQSPREAGGLAHLRRRATLAGRGREEHVRREARGS